VALSTSDFAGDGTALKELQGRTGTRGGEIVEDARACCRRSRALFGKWRSSLCEQWAFSWVLSQRVLVPFGRDRAMLLISIFCVRKPRLETQMGQMTPPTRNALLAEVIFECSIRRFSRFDCELPRYVICGLPLALRFTHAGGLESQIAWLRKTLAVGSCHLATTKGRGSASTPRVGTIKRLSSWLWLPFASRRVLQGTFTPHRSLNWKKTR
jgi:hypothetical protein